jgi:hypothetical protein
MALVIGARDCEAVISNDPKITLNERIIARQCLTIAFLSALVAIHPKTGECLKPSL